MTVSVWSWWCSIIFKIRVILLFILLLYFFIPKGLFKCHLHCKRNIYLPFTSSYMVYYGELINSKLIYSVNQIALLITHTSFSNVYLQQQASTIVELRQCLLSHHYPSNTSNLNCIATQCDAGMQLDYLEEEKNVKFLINKVSVLFWVELLKVYSLLTTRKIDRGKFIRFFHVD